jgi:hypothetical protein
VGNEAADVLAKVGAIYVYLRLRYRHSINGRIATARKLRQQWDAAARKEAREVASGEAQPRKTFTSVAARAAFVEAGLGAGVVTQLEEFFESDQEQVDIEDAKSCQSPAYSSA